MTNKQPSPAPKAPKEEVDKTPNYVLWIVGTILATAGLVFIQRNWSAKGESKKDKVYTGAADYLRERHKQVRKPGR